MQLQGPQITLRNWKLTDAAALQHNADNPKISTNLFDRFPSPYTIEAAEAWVERWQDQDPIINFAITINDEVIGGIGLEFRQDVYRQTPLMGYWLAEQHWGKGIMPEAVMLVVDYAFKNLEVIAIVANVFSKNPASMRVLEKSGFIKRGMIPQSAFKHGEILDEYVFSISKS